VYGDREEKRCGGPLNRAAAEREREREGVDRQSKKTQKNKERKKALLADC